MHPPRFAAMILLALALATPAGAGAESQRRRTGLSFDVVEYGAAPGQAIRGAGTLDDAWLAIKAAAPAPVNGAYPPIQVYIPGSRFDYKVAGPLIIDRPNTTIVGDGPEVSRISPAYGNGMPVVLFGLSAIPGGTALAGSHFIDLFGKMDTSLAPAAGRKWGYRTGTDSHLSFPPGCALASGPSDYWAATRQVTIDFAVDLRGAALVAGGTASPVSGKDYSAGLFGMDDIRPGASGPHPFAVRAITGGNFQVLFKTAEQGPSSYRSFSVPVTGFTGIVRVSAMIDLTNGVCAAYVKDGGNPAVQVDIGTPAAGGDESLPFTLASNLTFAPNYTHPFNVGVQSSASWCAEGSTPSQKVPYDVSLYGLKISKGLRYANNGAGTAQVRADNPATAITDVYRYHYLGDGSEIAYLALTDAPPGTAGLRDGGRLIHAVAGSANPNTGGINAGWFMSTELQGGGGAATVSGCGIRDVAVTSRSRWGPCIGLGAVRGFEARGVTTEGGFHGIGSWPLMGANWPVRVTDCVLSGAYDAGYFGYWQILRMRGIHSEIPGTSVIRLVGCDATVSDVYAGIHPVTDPSGYRPFGYQTIGSVHSDQYGGRTQFSGWHQDGENAGYPIDAFFRLENNVGAAVPTVVSIADCTVGQVKPGRPIVRLLDVAPSYKAAQFRMTGLSDFGRNSAGYVWTDGPLWRGTIEGQDFPSTVPAVVNTAADGIGNVIPILYADAPPTTGAWTVGATVVNAHPSSGSPERWRCTAAGTPGTWDGVDLP